MLVNTLPQSLSDSVLPIYTILAFLYCICGEATHIDLWPVGLRFQMALCGQTPPASTQSPSQPGAEDQNPSLCGGH